MLPLYPLSAENARRPADKKRRPLRMTPAVSPRIPPTARDGCKWLRCAAAAKGKPGSRCLLRIQPHQLHPGGGHIGDALQVMRLFHRMRQGHIPVILHLLHPDGMGFVRRCRRQRLQRLPAAGKRPGAHRPQNVAADGTAVPPAAPQIGMTVPVDSDRSRQQLRRGNSQRRRQRLQQPDVRQPPSRFP